MSNVILLVGLGFGDEGKGSCADHICRQEVAENRSVTVTRFNGGPQCGHNVVTPDGKHHTFAQFGSGTFVPGVRTHLSRHMVVNPSDMLNEEKHLRELGVTDAFERTTLEGDALITTPFHVLANRLREELRGDSRHGSCGMGVGETKKDHRDHPELSIFASYLDNQPRLLEKLKAMQDYKVAEFDHVETCSSRAKKLLKELRNEDLVYKSAQKYVTVANRLRLVGDYFLKDQLNDPKRGIVFEGAQGVLLDQSYGFFPHVTWSDTTFNNAYDLLGGFQGEVYRLGIARSYMTRHGAGPLVTEDPQLTIPEAHNGWGEWQQDFRVGHLDLVALKYAVDVLGGVDGIFLTHVDRFTPRSPVLACDGYDAGCHEALTWKGQKQVLRHISGEDLERQTRLTKVLSQLRPVYKTYPHGLASLISDIGHQVAPVVSLSRGPTANDKKTLFVEGFMTQRKLFSA